MDRFEFATGAIIMMKISGAGANTGALRSAPLMLGVALSLFASAALAQSADGASHPPSKKTHHEKKKLHESTTQPRLDATERAPERRGRNAAAPPRMSGFSVMGNFGFLNYRGNGSMSGTDIGGAPPTVTQSQSLNHTTPAGGVAVELAPTVTNACITISGGDDPTDITSGSPQAFSLCDLFLAIAAIDPGRATASFSGLNAGPAGTGTSFLKETWSIPIALGYRTPARTFGINVPGLSFDVHGGFDFDRFQAGFNLTEPGAGPGAPATSATKTWWQADPAVGVGARYQLSGGWFAGVDLNWAFARSQNVSAPSANFAPFQSYNLATGSHTLTTVMLNLGKSF